MSPVDFKKWQCPLSLFLFLDLPLDFEIVQCRLSILRNGNVPCHYNFKLFFFFFIAQFRLHSSSIEPGFR